MIIYFITLFKVFLAKILVTISISEAHPYRSTYPITLWGQKNPIKSMIYSTVTEGRYRCANLNTDFFFCLTITIYHPTLNTSHFSQYQFFLYETITEQRENGTTFDQIAEWLNEKGYISVRVKKFKGNHVHSIVKKKRMKDEKLDREYPEVWSDFSLEVVDKTLVNMYED